VGQLENHLLQQQTLTDRYFWHEVRWRAVQRYLPPTPVTLVDVGAGAGLLGRQLATDRPDVRYRFVEPIPSLAAQLQREHGAAALATIEDLGDADVVVLLDVLEHQPDDVAFLRELTATIQPDVRLVLTVPALPHLWSAWDVDLGHHRRYSRRSLRGALEAADLGVDEVSYLFPELWPVGMARRVRHPARTAGGGTPSEFRPLPRPVNATLIGVGALGISCRRALPFGTSLLAAARLRR
jgi:SAM-dependent methyltransferase